MKVAVRGRKPLNRGDGYAGLKVLWNRHDGSQVLFQVGA